MSSWHADHQYCSLVLWREGGCNITEPLLEISDHLGGYESRRECCLPSRVELRRPGLPRQHVPQQLKTSMADRV